MKKNRGFTLIEVLIAMSIMASSAVLLYLAWTGNQVRVRKMAINNKASLYLERIMSELEVEYINRINSLPDSDGGAFDDDPKFTWTMESQDFEMPDLRSVLISGDQGDEMLLTVIDKLTDYLNQSIKEMKVTVIFKEGKTKLRYSATTFLVDYNQALPIGAPPAAGGQ